MFDKSLRQVKEKILFPFAKIIGKYFHPNIVSVFAFILGLISCYFVLILSFHLAFIFWILNRIFDGIDGTAARVSNRQSDFGGYLDILLDFILYALIPISFTFTTDKNNIGSSSWFALVIMLGVFYVNAASWMFLSSILEKWGQSFNSNKKMTTITIPSGLIEGFETIVIYSLFFFLYEYLSIIYLIMSGLVIIGVIQRIIWAAIKL